MLTTQATRKPSKLLSCQDSIFPLVCLWSFNFPKNKPCSYIFFSSFSKDNCELRASMTSPLPLQRQTGLWKKIHYIFWNFRNFDDRISSFTGDLPAAPLSHGSRCRLSKQCSPEPSSPPLLTSSSTREPKWLKINAGGRRGSCRPAEWVSWSSSSLGHEGSSWCEMGHRVGAGLGAGEEMSPFSLGQCWRMCALHHCLVPYGPSSDASSPGRACTTGEMLSLLQNCYSLIVMEKKNKIRWTNFSWSWEEKACAISNLTANWTSFAVLSHQPRQQC